MCIRDRRQIGHFVAELIEAGPLRRQLVVVALRVAHEGRRALLVERVDDGHGRRVTITKLERPGQGVGRAAVAEAGVGGQDGDGIFGPRDASNKNVTEGVTDASK